MATKFTSGTVINAGAVIVGVDADAPPAAPSAPAPEPAPASEPQILPLSSAVSLLLDASATADGSVVDSSTNSQPITVNGDVSQSSFSPYRSGGYSWEFDGSGDYLTSSNENDDFSFGNGDFTIETWAYYKTMPSGNGYPASAWILGGGPTNNNTGFDIAIGSTNIQVGLSSFLNLNINAPHGISAGEWYHIAIVRNGSDLSFYRNGTLIVSADVSGVTADVMSTGIAVGAAEPSGAVSGNPNAIYSDVRVVKGTAVYTEDFTPPTERLTAVTGTSLLTCNLPYLQSGLTAHGDVSPVAAGPYDYAGYSESLHGGSYVFDGNGDYLYSHDSSNAIGTQDFTLECWIYAEGNPSDQAIFESRSPGGPTDGFTLTAFSSSVIRIWCGGALVSSSGTNYVNEWTHLAVTRSSGTMTLYINGISQGSASTSFNLTNDEIIIGAGRYFDSNADPSSFFNGNITDLRIVKGTAVYTADFTPPTAPLEAVTGTSLLLSGNNASIRDESQTTEKLTVHGSIPSSDSSPYGSGKSMDFSGSYITSSDGIDFSDNDFTIELWWYPTDAGRQGLFHGSYGADWSIGIDYNSTYNNPTLGFWASSNGSSWDIANSDPGGNGITTGSPTQNAWNHIAYVRNGSTLTMYLNGVNVGEVTGVTAPIHSKTNTHQQSIGTWWKATGWGGGPMSGNVADYRIVTGEAVYTENFSVPTAPLGDYSESAPAPAPEPEPEPAPAPEPEPEPYTDPVWPVLLDRAVYNSTEGTGSGTLTFGDWTYGSIFDNGQGTRHPIGTVTDQGLRIQAPHWSGGDWWIEPDTSGKVQVEIIGRYDNFEGSYSRIDLFLTNGPVDSTDTPDLVIVSEGTQGSDTFMVYAYLNGNSRITIRTLNTINGVSTIEKVTLL